jgi:hypothetical protein
VSAFTVVSTATVSTATVSATTESAAGAAVSAFLQEAKANATTQNNNTFFITLNFKNLTI